MLLLSKFTTRVHGGKRMLNKMKIFIAVVALSGTVSANVQAETVTGPKADTLWKLAPVQNPSVVNVEKWNDLTINPIHPEDVPANPTETHDTVKKGDTLWDKAKDYHVSVSLIKQWNKLITDFIHPALNLSNLNGLNTNNAIAAVPSPPPAEAAPEPATAPEPSPAPVASTPARAPAPAPADNTSSKEITVKATAYTASCDGCSGITATGIDIKSNPNEKVIAVDPSVIPLGSKVYVEGFGEATAADTGGAIKGNRIDVFIPSEQDALHFGVKQLKVQILN
jgi:3D (Asp-Asp-Asp) domain-containing protein/LysM repeat protein